MKKFTVKKENQNFKIFSEEKNFAEIIFDKNNIEATLQTDTITLRVERGDTKDLVLKENTKIVFTFKFDYVWGGAQLVSNGLDTGFDIKGRWFKPGTRLTNDEDKDLIVAVKKNDGLEVTVFDESISEKMILATIYYHIYSSKMMSSMIASGIY